MRSKSVAHAWRPYSARERKFIDNHLTDADGSRCPRCTDILEAHPSQPILECRTCQRFHPRSTETPEVLYLVRMQRLASAILTA